MLWQLHLLDIEHLVQVRNLLPIQIREMFVEIVWFDISIKFIQPFVESTLARNAALRWLFGELMILSKQGRRRYIPIYVKPNLKTS